MCHWIFESNLDADAPDKGEEASIQVASPPTKVPGIYCDDQHVVPVGFCGVRYDFVGSSSLGQYS